MPQKIILEPSGRVLVVRGSSRSKKDKEGAAFIDAEKLGAIIAGARREAGIRSQEAFARRLVELGLSDATQRKVQTWEDGTTLMRIHEAIAVIIALRPPGGLTRFRPALTREVWNALFQAPGEDL